MRLLLSTKKNDQKLKPKSHKPYDMDFLKKQNLCLSATAFSFKFCSLIILGSIAITSHAIEFDQDFENSSWSSPIIGKVFDDSNKNGVQDKNEAGIPGVRLISVTGLVIETDGYGRFNIADEELTMRHKKRHADGQASNFILKIDSASLPRGASILSENPRVVKLTSPTLNRINFAVSF